MGLHHVTRALRPLSGICARARHSLELLVCCSRFCARVPESMYARVTDMVV